MILFDNKLTGELIEIYEMDLESAVNYNNAMKMISELGVDWRLPTILELQMFDANLFKKGLGNFKKHMTYWSSDNDGNNFKALTFGGHQSPFNNGSFDINHYPNEGYNCLVRPVRTLSIRVDNSDKTSTIQIEEKKMRTGSQTIVIGNKKYEIADMDLLPMTFEDARKKEDEQWAIPDFDVLNQMYQLREKLGGFEPSSKYWCNSIYYNFESEHDPKDGFVWTIHFGNGHTELLDPEKDRCKIRLVRQINNHNK